jgi:hypothetical protein
MTDGRTFWLQWQRTICPENITEIESVEVDRGRYLGYVRAVGRRRADVKLDEPIVSVPTRYKRQPLLRERD